MRYITHSKYRNWSKCDVRRILNCDIYRIYFLNAMYVASACGVLLVWLPGGLAAAGEGAGERVGETVKRYSTPRVVASMCLYK